MSRLSPQFKSEFTELLTKDLKLSSNEFDQQGMKIMQEHKLLNDAKQVPAKYFLTHKENRNTLMLNAKNVHKQSNVIYNMGADRNAPHKHNCLC